MLFRGQVDRIFPDISLGEERSLLLMQTESVSAFQFKKGTITGQKNNMVGIKNMKEKKGIALSRETHANNTNLEFQVASRR